MKTTIRGMGIFLAAGCLFLAPAHGEGPIRQPGGPEASQAVMPAELVMAAAPEVGYPVEKVLASRSENSGYPSVRPEVTKGATPADTQAVAMTGKVDYRAAAADRPSEGRQPAGIGLSEPAGMLLLGTGLLGLAGVRRRWYPRK